MNMPKTTALFICLILSLVIHYVGIESIPVPKKKSQPIAIELTTVEGDSKVKSEESEKQAQIPDPKKDVKPGTEDEDPLKGKNKFNNFGEETGDSAEVCAEKNTYTGVGAAFETREIVVNKKLIVLPTVISLNKDHFVKIKSIKPGSPLDRARVKAGDYIDVKIQSIMKQPLGSPITVAVLSNNKKRMIILKSELICFH